jgi:hypothetical protein
VTWPARPLRSSPITGPSSLLRAGPPLCLASVLSPMQPWPHGVLPLDDQGVNITHFDWPFVSRRQVLLFHASACNELTPPLHRAPPEPHTGSSLAEDVAQGHDFVPGSESAPGFDAVFNLFDASAVVQPCSSSRCLPDPLVAGLFPSRFPPRLLTGMTLRRFGLLACTTSPEDLPPSLAQHGSCWRSSTSSSRSFQDTPPRSLLSPGFAVDDWR